MEKGLFFFFVSLGLAFVTRGVHWLSLPSWGGGSEGVVPTLIKSLLSPPF